MSSIDHNVPETMTICRLSGAGGFASSLRTSRQCAFNCSNCLLWIASDCVGLSSAVVLSALHGHREPECWKPRADPLLGRIPELELRWHSFCSPCSVQIAGGLFRLTVEPLTGSEFDGFVYLGIKLLIAFESTAMRSRCDRIWQHAFNGFTRFTELLLGEPKEVIKFAYIL